MKPNKLNKPKITKITIAFEELKSFIEKQQEDCLDEEALEKAIRITGFF